MNKVIIVRFEFDEDVWRQIRKHYNESEVRLSLHAGALGELGQLLEQQEKRAELIGDGL